MQRKKPYVITIVGPESSGKSTLSNELAMALDCPRVPEYAREYLEGLDRPYVLEDLDVIAVRQWERIKLAVSLEQIEKQIESPSILTTLTNKDLNVKSGLFSSIGRQEDEEFLEGNAFPLAEEPKWAKRFVTYQRELFGLEARPMVIIDSGMLSLRLWARIKYGIDIPFVEEKLKKDETSMYVLMRPLPEWQPDPLREAPSLLERSWIFNQYAAELASMIFTPR